MKLEEMNKLAEEMKRTLAEFKEQREKADRDIEGLCDIVFTFCANIMTELKKRNVHQGTPSK